MSKLLKALVTSIGIAVAVTAIVIVVLDVTGATKGAESDEIIKINEPRMMLLNNDGVVVATGSTTIAKAMQKSSGLAPGQYTLRRPDVSITVKTCNGEAVANIPPVANAGEDYTIYVYPQWTVSTDGVIHKDGYAMDNSDVVEALIASTSVRY